MTKKTSNMINISLSQPDITQKEIKSVVNVLKTPNLALGPKLKEFENKFAEYVGVKYAIAVNSGTGGLHLLTRALGIKKGDEVITTPFSFIASANCILFENAKPVFVDIDSETLNIDPKKIEKAVTPQTKAVLGVDIFGYPADWDKILKIARKYKLKVIEDSCEALGAMYKSQITNKNLKWRKCGTFGDAGVFAFYPNKQITTGEGGIIVTNNQDIADNCRGMMNQGRRVENGKWLEHFQLGYNYRMSDINAALGLAQLSRVEEILKKRDKVAKIYNKYFAKIPEIKTLPSVNYGKRSWFVYVVQLSLKYNRQERDKIINNLREKGIQCGNYFQCIHLQPFYKNSFGYQGGEFPIAESISERTIALPFYSNLKENQIKYIVNELKECLKN